ncbi:MAG: hypothetical protein ACI4N6_02325 [Eubacteriales bacterium]
MEDIITAASANTSDYTILPYVIIAAIALTVIVTVCMSLIRSSKK